MGHLGKGHCDGHPLMRKHGAEPSLFSSLCSTPRGLSARVPSQQVVVVAAAAAVVVVVVVVVSVAGCVVLLLVCCCLVDCCQTWRHHMATTKRVMVTPVVRPRLFEILTSLTVGAPRRNPSASTAFETIATKTQTMKALSSRCDQLFIMNCQETQPQLEGKCVSVGVDALAVVS